MFAKWKSITNCPDGRDLASHASLLLEGATNVTRTIRELGKGAAAEGCPVLVAAIMLWEND